MLLSIILSILLSTVGIISEADLKAKADVLSMGTTNAHFEDPSFEPDSMTIQRALKGYLEGLKHPIEGVVESAIYQSMLLSIKAPSANMMEIQYQLKELSLVHPSQSIRLRAFLAHEFFADSEYRESIQIALMNRKEDQEPSEIFRSLSERLNAQALIRFK